eukprot:scaffold1554_cov401-Prasinococcus_capsulatus_cf.AAC.34
MSSSARRSPVPSRRPGLSFSAVGVSEPDGDAGTTSPCGLGVPGAPESNELLACRSSGPVPEGWASSREVLTIALLEESLPSALGAKKCDSFSCLPGISLP